MITSPSPFMILRVCQPSLFSKPLSLCSLTQIGLQLQKHEAVQPRPKKTQNGEEVLTDTSNAGHRYTAILVVLQPSHSSGAAIPPGGSSRAKYLLAHLGHLKPANTGKAELVRGAVTWSSTTMKLTTPRSGFSKACAGNHCSLFLAGT